MSIWGKPSTLVAQNAGLTWVRLPAYIASTLGGTSAHMQLYNSPKAAQQRCNTGAEKHTETRRAKTWERTLETHE